MRKTAESVRALQRKKAPYKAKVELIRSKQLPKALYGCETAPVNESALKQLQTRIVDTLTFTTTRRSADLTFATAANGKEVDPDVAIFKNRVLGMRRARVICEENRKMIDQIMETYLEAKEPGIFEYSKANGEALKEKEESGEPMSRQRAKIRRQCKPKGAIGYLLETVHLNQACMDMEFNIWQYNQTPIRVTEVVYQVVGPQVQQMAARNRTARKEDSREECMGLKEIDREATYVMIKGATDEDMMVLNITTSRGRARHGRKRQHTKQGKRRRTCVSYVGSRKDRTTFGRATCLKKIEKWLTRNWQH
jgi:hypothetical protein